MAADRALRIAYPVSWSHADTSASCEQAVHTAAALGRIGHSVTLIAPSKAGDHATADEMASAYGLRADFTVLPIRSRWAGDSLVRGMGWLSQLFRGGLLADFDIMLCRLPAILGLGASAPLPFVFDHYRPWADVYPMARPFIRRSGNAHQSIGFALHSALATDSYRRAGVEDRRLLVAHNGSHPGAPAPDPGKIAARQALGLDPLEKLVVYTGRVNPQKGLDQLLAMARLRPEIRFLIVGSESEGPIEREARALPNVGVVGWQSAERLPLYLAAADVLLIPPSSEPLQRFGNCILPLKTFAYLGAGRPILAPALPDTADLLRDGETALLVPPDDAFAAVAALDGLLADDALADRLSTRARALAQDCSWDARASRLNEFILRRLGEMKG